MRKYISIDLRYGLGQITSNISFFCILPYYHTISILLVSLKLTTGAELDLTTGLQEKEELKQKL